MQRDQLKGIIMELKINYITGYAGTGKSTELLKLSKTLDPKNSIIIAPTHKALTRLINSLGLDNNIEFKTIHSLLGWIPTINENAKHINGIDTTISLDLPLSAYKNIVIDEGGMMSEDMLMEIVGKIDCLGYDADGNLEDPEIANSMMIMHIYLDPYQLLPVRGQQIQVDPDTTRNLTTQYRSESKDIVDLYTRYVTYLATNGMVDNTSDPIVYSDNILPFSIKDFKVGDRLLAYTNKAVGTWNKHIAKQLGINSYVGQEVQLGNMIDTLVVDDWYEFSGIDEIIEHFNNGTLILQNSRISKEYLEYSLKALLSHKDIKFIKSGLCIYPVIPGIYKARNILHKAKEEALKNRKMFKHIYTLGRAFIMDYTFATTVHKSQGSEFSTVYVDKKDISKAIDKSTYARLMYVAISRCINKLYI